jgi:hypothetical protein
MKKELGMCVGRGVVDGQLPIRGARLVRLATRTFVLRWTGRTRRAPLSSNVLLCPAMPLAKMLGTPYEEDLDKSCPARKKMLYHCPKYVRADHA